jgi:DNA-binding beta-propeller fold protein YncE
VRRAVSPIVLALGLGACGGQAVWRPQQAADSALARYRWPPPPEQPRIALVAQWQLEPVLAERRGFGARVLDVIAGGVGWRNREDSLYLPAGVAVADDGTMVVTDARRAAAVLFRAEERPRELQPRGGRLLGPVGVAAAPGGFIVADGAGGRLYRVADAGHLAPFADAVPWVRPVGVAVDSLRGRVVVVDAEAHVVHVLGLDGRLLFTIGRRGGRTGEFNYPTFVAIGPGGEIIIVDTMNFRVQVFDASGAFVRAFGSPGDAAGHFAAPKGICADGEGRLFIADARFSAMHVYDLEGRLLFALGRFGSAPDEFALPTGVACDGSGHVYVADTWNHRVSVFRVWPSAGD